MITRETRVNMLIGTNHCLSHFYSLTLPPLFIVWQAAFHASFSELGLSVAVMALASASLQTPYGFLVDRYGARPFLIGGSLAMSLGVLLMGFTTSFWQVVVLAFISGAGNAVIHPADYSILSGSIRKESIGRSFAMHTFSGNAGFVLAPIVMAVLIPTIGWRGALIAVGCAGLVAVGLIVVQSRILVEQTRVRDRSAHLSTRDLLTSRTLWLFFGFYLLSAMSSGGLQAWLITILRDVKGIPFEFASMGLTALLLGVASGTLLGGYVTDKYPRMLVGFTISFTLFSAAMLLAVGLLPMGAVVALGLLFIGGFTMGASRTPRDVMLKDASPKGQIGKVFGFVSSGLPLGSALTPVPFGYLLDHKMPDLVLPMAAVLLLLSLLCMGSAKILAAAEAAEVPLPVPAE